MQVLGRCCCAACILVLTKLARKQWLSAEIVLVINERGSISKLSTWLRTTRQANQQMQHETERTRDTLKSFVVSDADVWSKQLDLCSNWIVFEKNTSCHRANVHPKLCSRAMTRNNTLTKMDRVLGVPKLPRIPEATAGEVWKELKGKGDDSVFSSNLSRNKSCTPRDHRSLWRS